MAILTAINLLIYVVALVDLARRFFYQVLRLCTGLPDSLLSMEVSTPSSDVL